MVLKINYGTVKLQKVTYGLNFMTSWRLRNRKCVIKMISLDFSIFKFLPWQILVALLIPFVYWVIDSKAELTYALRSFLF